MINIIAIQSQLKWVATKTRSGKWIGECDPLNIAMEADSLDELYSLIPESIHLMFTDLLEDNELDAFLRERGWEAHYPVNRNAKDMGFHVPWELIASDNRGNSSSVAC